MLLLIVDKNDDTVRLINPYHPQFAMSGFLKMDNPKISIPIYFLPQKHSITKSPKLCREDFVKLLVLMFWCKEVLMTEITIFQTPLIRNP